MKKSPGVFCCHLRLSARGFAVLAAFLLGSARVGVAQSASDSAAIRAAALDYIEGYYEGNGERMERALHPELAKRIIRNNDQGASQFSSMSAMALVQGTRAGYGTKIAVAERRKDVTILDIYQNAASVKIYASGWVDYLHLAKSNGHWVIVNVLWELHPKKP